MTDLRKAAEQALEALQYTCDYLPAKTGVERDVDDAITALRQALAQSEQEPVAWVIEDGEVDYYVDVVAKIKPGTPLYAASPKREWVGLTDEDLEPMCDDWRIIFGPYVHDFAKAIEAKLKEKNNGN